MARWALGACLLLALGLRLDRIQERPPDNDEKGLIEAAQGMRPLAAHRQPPLAIGLLTPLVHVIGAMGVLRAPSLVFGLALVIAAFAFARRIAGPSAALWAAVIMATSPVQIGFSGYLKAYSAGALGVLLTVFIHWLARQEPHRRRWHILWPVTAACGFYAHYLAAIPIALSALSLMRRSRLAVWGALVTALLTVPLAPWVMSVVASPLFGAHPDEPRFRFAALSWLAQWNARAPEVYATAGEFPHQSALLLLGIVASSAAGLAVLWLAVRNLRRAEAGGHLSRTVLVAGLGINVAMLIFAPGGPFALALVQPLLAVLAAVAGSMRLRCALVAGGLIVSAGVAWQPWPDSHSRAVARQVETLAQQQPNEPLVLAMNHIWDPPVLAALSPHVDMRRPASAGHYVGWIVSLNDTPIYIWDLARDLGGPGREAGLPKRFRFVAPCEIAAPGICQPCADSVRTCVEN